MPQNCQLARTKRSLSQKYARLAIHANSRKKKRQCEYKTTKYNRQADQICKEA